jgi:hypothetical protein
MELIAHRRNAIEELASTPEEFGVEIDLRSFGDRLVVTHDVFIDAVDFEDWLSHYAHGTLILNVKEEGIEDRVAEVVKSRGIERFFFLDLSFPALERLTREGEPRVAVRYSEFESIETVLSLQGRADWVWVDCFSRYPIDASSAKRLTQAGFRLCMVSPELQGHAVARISEFQDYLDDRGITPSAVCTKRPDLWESK